MSRPIIPFGPFLAFSDQSGMGTILFACSSFVINDYNYHGCVTSRYNISISNS
jgi:hypothetical protein